MQLYAGIEIGGTKLQLVAGNGQGRILERRKLEGVAAKGAQGIREQIAKVLPELLSNHKISAGGAGFGGPVDWRNGKICRSHQIEGWSEFDLAGWLQQLTGVMAFGDNDANVAALGEGKHGAGTGSNPEVYV